MNAIDERRRKHRHDRIVRPAALPVYLTILIERNDTKTRISLPGRTGPGRIELTATALIKAAHRGLERTAK